MKFIDSTSAAPLTALLLGTMALTPSALAQAETNISGQWTFTANLRVPCDFGGAAHLTQTSENRYSIELTANQSCPTLDEEFLVRQECIGSRLGNQLSIRCTIAEFVNGYESQYYYPDNFTLTIASSKRMHGALVSSGSANPAEWKRAEGGIS